MVVWENSKDELNLLKSLYNIQNSLITNLLKMNQDLYDQLNNYKLEHEKASKKAQEDYEDFPRKKYGTFNFEKLDKIRKMAKDKENEQS